MRFAIDAHAIGRRLTGNEVYVRSLINAMAAEGQAWELMAYVSSEEASQTLAAGVRTSRVATNPFLRLGADLSTKVWKDQPDLLHVQYTAPLACPVPVVATVHDVSYLEHPEYFTRERALQLKWTVRRTVQRAAKILTGSESARNSILKVYGELAEDKVVVVPIAASPAFRRISRESAAAAVRDRFSLAAPFLLGVGDLQPRKNQIGLIRAFARLVREFPQFPHNLVLAGKATWFAPRVYQAARDSGVADRIRFLGFVSDQELLHLYNACDVFVFPSYYEGFGIPVLEAMACGRAVICSNTSSLPEVADGAALLFDPYSVNEMVRAMADLLLDSELRSRMERLGIQRAAQFSWKRAAQETLDVYYTVAESTRATVPVAGSPTVVHR
jgi:glycosyltransferase involved in cell wall biosynthesis